MSRRNWSNGLATGLTIGLGLFVLIFVLSSYLIGEVNCQKYGQSDHAASSNSKGKQDSCNPPEWWSITQRLVSFEDTLAQWVMAFLSFAALGVSAWAVLLVRESLDKTNEAIGAARTANDIARKSAELQNRAWVNVNRTEVVCSPDGNASITVVISNRGQTPASNVRAYIGAAWAGNASNSYPTIDYHGSRGTAVLMRDDTHTFVFQFKMPDPEKVNIAKYGFCLSIHVTYRDAFNVKRRTLYSGWITVDQIMDGLKSLNVSDKHNRST
jgi:hypothetical protein